MTDIFFLNFGLFCFTKQEEEGQLFDVLLSFSSEDKEIAEKVKESLEQQSPGIRVFNTVFHFDHSLVWQADIYDMMKRSTK